MPLEQKERKIKSEKWSKKDKQFHIEIIFPTVKKWKKDFRKIFAQKTFKIEIKILIFLHFIVVNQKGFF